MLCRELCASYGDSLYNILANKDKATGKKPDSMKDEEWTALVNKYDRAVSA
jgi:hypothetical protein